jgi:diaminopimelate decarboxylase
VSAISITAAHADAFRRAARRFGTPAYVTDLEVLATAARAVTEAFPEPWLRAFSVKANDVPAVIAAVAAHGFSANVVSRGEWAAAVPTHPEERHADDSCDPERERSRQWS